MYFPLIVCRFFRTEEVLHSGHVTVNLGGSKTDQLTYERQSSSYYREFK